jgi:dephospho-CoA kinase
MKIFGSIGRIGSGKDEVTKYLSNKYDLLVISVGDIVREKAAEEGLALTRENLHRVSAERMRKYGKDYFMCLVLKRIRENKRDQAGITGIRTPDDVRFLKQYVGKDFVLFHVLVADPHVRYERIRERRSERDPETYDDFLEQDKTEEAMFHIEEASAMADYSLDNSRTLEDLHRQIDEIIARKEYQVTRNRR